jgi:hypothetical protein
MCLACLEHPATNQLRDEQATHTPEEDRVPIRPLRPVMLSKPREVPRAEKREHPIEMRALT